MYIDNILIKNLRNFREAKIELLAPGKDLQSLSIPVPELPNVNLVLGNNAAGKTSFLKAVALTALGPAISDAGIFPYQLLRREPNDSYPQPQLAEVEADFILHEQDGHVGTTHCRVVLSRRGDLEQLRWDGNPDDSAWNELFSETSEAFFFVGYGATRRVEKSDRTDAGSRKSSQFSKAQRIQSLFEDSYSLFPLASWLPAYLAGNPGRHKQVVTLLNKLLGPGHFTFSGDIEQGEYVFERGGLTVAFPALSDGYRAYLGWIGDLLYHVCNTCPPGKRLDENKGIVMIDEIDLHLHPKWQMTVVPTLAKALPNLQFIITSHSPLVVGTLEWMNVILLQPEADEASSMSRLPQAINGLDADQILLTDFFGLSSSRAPAAQAKIDRLTEEASQGDPEAAINLLQSMTEGSEASK